MKITEQEGKEMASMLNYLSDNKLVPKFMGASVGIIYNEHERLYVIQFMQENSEVRGIGRTLSDAMVDISCKIKFL